MAGREGVLDVAFDEALRRETEETADKARQLIAVRRDASAGLREAVRELFSHR